VSWQLSRRDFIGLALGTAAGAALRPAFASTSTEVPLHGLSAFGELKYPPGFHRFDYANAEAPSGGRFSFAPPNWQFNQNVQTFNTLNSFVAKGDAPPRMELCFDSLMTRAIDEPDAVYGLLAESVMLSADRNTFTFRLRPHARFHDGTPVTADDIAFSYELFRDKGHPYLQLPLKPLKQAVADGTSTLRLVFDGTQSERAILTLVEYPVVSRADIEANGFDSASLRPLVGSGPYRVERVSAGRTIVYARDPDWWGKDLAVARGLMHFDELVIEFFTERQAGFEAFKKGDVHFREEFTSKTWATEYDFPAIAQGKVVKRTFEAEKTPSFQAWAINQRRARFADPRIREAIGLCFDFEWTREKFFYGSYERSHSMFEKSDLKAEGLPTASELALLEAWRGKIPDEAFGEAVMQPTSDGSGRDRANLRKAANLIAAAGFKRNGATFVDDKGVPLTLEMLVQDEVFVRVDTPFIEAMRAIGIDASIRLVDAAQFQSRQNDFDFDMIGLALSLSASPTRDELERIFHSRAAALPGSYNLPGTADPAIDALVDAAGAAKDRDELVSAMRALDRVLRARRDWIPNWYAANHRTAFWDMFGFSEAKPDYGFPVETLWWFDETKARAIGKL
jgi:microcin C transport system substrate-binding protein